MFSHISFSLQKKIEYLERMTHSEQEFVIHCIGDSHVNFFNGYDKAQVDPETNMIKSKYPFFKTYWIGPVLAYNLCRKNTTTKGREKLFLLLEYIPKGSNLMFCFGEIDCRAHIVLQAEKQGREPSEIVKNVVDRYFKVLKEVQDMGYKIIVWNVIPSAPTDVNTWISVSDEYLFHGTCQERNHVTKLFNTYLKSLVEPEGMFFLDFFDKLMNEDGSVKTEYYCKDDIHISQKVMPIVLDLLKKEYREIESSFKAFLLK